MSRQLYQQKQKGGGYFMPHFTGAHSAPYHTARNLRRDSWQRDMQ
jgi:hypothetical protein